MQPWPITGAVASGIARYSLNEASEFLGHPIVVKHESDRGEGSQMRCSEAAADSGGKEGRDLGLWCGIPAVARVR